MATCYPHTDSGDGDTYGADRLEATLTYVSIIDYVDDDPIALVERLLPIESRHPLDRWSDLRVQRYVQRKTSSPVVWHIDVIFDYPDRAGFRGWRTHATFGNQSERVFVDLNGKVVGAHMYEPRPPADPGATPTAFYTKTVKGLVDLHRPEGDARRREGFDVFTGAATVVLSRTLRNMTAEKMRLVQGFLSPRASCNAEKFLAWQPGELLFQQAVIREEHGPTGDDERIEGFAYPTELHFAIKLASANEPDGWRTVRQYDWYQDDRGNESLVLDRADDKPVSDLYVRYPERNFAEIIAILEGGSPRSGLTRPKR